MSDRRPPDSPRRHVAPDRAARGALLALREWIADLRELARGDAPRRPVAPSRVRIETAGTPVEVRPAADSGSGEEQPPRLDAPPPAAEHRPGRRRRFEVPQRLALPAMPPLPALPFAWNAYMAVLTMIATLTFLAFLLIEPSPRWVLLLGAGAVAMGMDGTLRGTWREPFASGAETAPYLFLPALYAFAAPILIEHNASGYAVVPWAFAAGLGFAAIVVAEVSSVRFGSTLYPYARLVASGAAYFVAFVLLAMTYVLQPGLAGAVIATWLIATMLGVELLREGEVDPAETALLATVAGLVVAQVRWLTYFLPVDGYLAGLALLLAFFLVIGLLHAYVTRTLSAVIVAEYGAIASVGLLVVVAARAAGIA